MMIWTTNANKLLTILRGPKPFVFLDKVTLNYKGEKFDGLGTMDVDFEHNRFEIDFRFQYEAVPIEFLEWFNRQSAPSIENPEDFWEAEVTTASGIRFSMRVPPPYNSKWGPGKILRFWSHVEAIEVLPDSWDTGDGDVQSAHRKRIETIFTRDRVINSEATKEADAALDMARSQAPPKFHVILARVALGVTNTAEVGTHHHPLEGERSHFKFGLYKEEHEDYSFCLESVDDDLHVSMYFNDPKLDCGDCRKKLQALLSAVAFTHGYHSWPLLEEHCLGGHVVTCRIKPYFNLERSEFQPLNEHLSRSHKECGAMIGIATKFFSGERPMVSRFLEFAFLHRDAGMKAVPLKVQVLAACTVFEGLVTELLKEHQLEEAALLSEDGKAFDAAKNAALVWSRAQGAGQAAANTPWARISSRLENSPYLRTKEKVRAVGDHYGLPWEGDLKEVYGIWEQVRHALAHGASGEMDFNRSRKFFTAWSRLSGSIYRLMLAEMGYAGWFRYSPMEDGKDNLEIRPVHPESITTDPD
jgi:hypothetical protein